MYTGVLQDGSNCAHKNHPTLFWGAITNHLWQSQEADRK